MWYKCGKIPDTRDNYCNVCEWFMCNKCMQGINDEGKDEETNIETATNIETHI